MRSGSSFRRNMLVEFIVSWRVEVWNPIIPRRLLRNCTSGQFQTNADLDSRLFQLRDLPTLSI